MTGMKRKRLTADDLKDRVIDCHSHLGVSLKSYACMEYPYAQSLEGLYYRQKSAGVDVNIVFPFSADLFFDPAGFKNDEKRPAVNPLSEAPYKIENETVMREVFVFNPELSHRFIPFVSVDPAREVEKQLECLLELEESYPIYGIKVVPVGCQSKITALLEEGRAILEFAGRRNIPFLFHTTADASEDYSYAADCFEVIEENADLRFCLAHCIGFHKGFLDKAAEMPDVWVDTSALKIQVQCARENNRIAAPEESRFKADYSDHTAIMKRLVEEYPDTMIWGSDSPAYAYICRRRQGENSFLDFRLKASYEDEKAALDSLPVELRMRACNGNTTRFLFGT